MVTYYIAIEAVDIVALMLLIPLLCYSQVIDRQRKKAFLAADVFIAVIILAEMCTTLCDVSPAAFRIPNAVANAVGFSMSPFVPCILAIAFGARGTKAFHWLMSPCILNALLSVLSIRTGWIFSVSQTNVYSRGPLFFVYVAVYMWSLLLFFIISLKCSSRRRQNTPLLMALLVIFINAAAILQIVWPALHVTWTCSTIAIIMEFAFICSQNDRYDSITMLLNRRMYEDAIRHLQDKSYVAVVFLDVDDFKSVNDKFGHLTGDRCLAVLSSILFDTFNASGDCYRIGGDEFCWLSESAKEADIQRQLALLDSRVEKCRKRDQQIPSISYGYSIYRGEEGRSLDDALGEADRRAYECKRLHKLQESDTITLLNTHE